MTMTYEEFHNALRILRNIDMDELEMGGVLRKGNYDGFIEFRMDPYKWFIQAPDISSRKVFKIIQKRGGTK